MNIFTCRYAISCILLINKVVSTAEKKKYMALDDEIKRVNAHNDHDRDEPLQYLKAIALFTKNSDLTSKH